MNHVRLCQCLALCEKYIIESFESGRVPRTFGETRTIVARKVQNNPAFMQGELLNSLYFIHNKFGVEWSTQVNLSIMRNIFNKVRWYQSAKCFKQIRSGMEAFEALNDSCNLRLLIQGPYFYHNQESQKDEVDAYNLRVYIQRYYDISREIKEDKSLSEVLSEETL